MYDVFCNSEISKHKRSQVGIELPIQHITQTSQFTFATPCMTVYT